MIKPDILYSWLKNSHPTIYERIENIEYYMIGSHRTDQEVAYEE